MSKDGRGNSGGMTVCKYCKHNNLQAECTYFIKASYDRRCMYLKYEEYCDYHEDMKCAKDKEAQRKTPADLVKERFQNAKAKSLYEINDDLMREAIEAECGV